jgi:uncharacterized protein (TIGR00251 family)
LGREAKDRETPGFLLRVSVKPGASKTELAGLMSDGGVRVRVRAEPLRGEANRELTVFLAARLGIRASSVRIVRGQKTKSKILRIQGVSQARAMELLKEV